MFDSLWEFNSLPKEKLQHKSVILRALNDPDETVLSNALSVIGAKNWRESYLIIKSFLQHPNGKVRAKAFSIFSSRYIVEHELLIQMLKDPDYYVRGEAAKWLGETKEKESIPILRKFVRKEKEDLAKFYFYRSLYNLSRKTHRIIHIGRFVTYNKKYLKGLINLIHSPSDEVRRKILIEFMCKYHHYVIWDSFCLPRLYKVLQRQLQKEKSNRYFVERLLDRVEGDYKKYKKNIERFNDMERKCRSLRMDDFIRELLLKIEKKYKEFVKCEEEFK